MITDVERATTCRCKFKAPLIDSKCTKNEGHSENMVLNGKIILRFQEEKSRINTLDHSKEPNGAPGL